MEISDEENNIKSVKNSNNYRKLLDSESSSEEEREEEKENELETDDIKNLSKNRNILKSSSDESDKEEENQSAAEVKKNRRKGIPHKRDINKPKERVKRKSALKAIDDIKEKNKLKELSEKQKNERDKEVRIHYHKPKQYSLKEFLARKNINKPSIERLKEQNNSNTINSMKMTAEQLEKFAHKMKEREEEALEFFKSESESDDEEENQSVTEVIQPEEKDSVAENEHAIVENLNSPSNKEEKIEDEPIEKTETVEIVPDIINDEKEKEEILPCEETVEVEKSKNEEESRAIPVLKTLNEMSGNVIIDLETGVIRNKKLTGAEMLFQTFLKTQAKPKNKETVCMNILSVENGKLENQRVEVKLDKEIELDHNRPGYSHEKLKENLRNQIVHKRLQELKIKSLRNEQHEFEPEEKCKDELPSESNDNENDEDDDECVEDEEEDEEIIDDEEEIYSERKKKKNPVMSAFIDNEAVDEEDEQNDEEEDSDESSESESDDEDNTEEIKDGQPRKSRIIKAFVDSDDEDNNKVKKSNDEVDSNMRNLQKVDILKESEELFNSQGTDFTFNEPSVSEEIQADDNKLEKLFDTASSQVEDEDLMQLCSGQFASTQADFNSSAILTNNDFNISSLDNNDADVPANNVEDDDDDFVSQVPEREKEVEPVESVKVVVEQSKNIRKFLESTDDEVEESNEKERNKIKKKKKKRKIKKLGFSDDENESDENNENPDEIDYEDEEEEEMNEEDKEVFVDYDSEENEIEVEVNKKEKLKIIKDYFEGEAELSESEWGSADEDEKDMDKYDAELADNEHYDEDKMREEIVRVHGTKERDDDEKMFKKIKELLFKDEENDGIGRERRFRWKNQTEGFTLEDENARDADNPDNLEDEESEITWRRMRHERETLINEQSQKMIEGETMGDDILLLDQSSQTVTSTNTSSLAKRKFQIIKTTSNSLGNSISESSKKSSPFLIKANPKRFTNSFLSRDEQTLNKIASYISVKDNDEVTNLSSHGGNSMSFAPIEKKVVDESKKRKSEGENEANIINKKRKVENNRFLLDQLN